ncbi:hypothetical protein HPB48_012399 [Haemaphysalis longicornis]|uniref:Cytochrome c oxidase assembly factor 3 mitochondrial coiled-coil domain-containing protein n=1 Tax=Haemaphysalis longicornis TaxID=44386 RepID=A0A9J6G2N6_HAELO|nr:hypothetical protein HPB48_012399 [Haemaphysalis longicornis]
MSGDNVMPKIDVQKELSGSAHLNYMKIIERDNMERVRRLKRMRQRNLFTGFLLTGGVLGICILFIRIACRRGKNTFYDQYFTCCMYE